MGFGSRPVSMVDHFEPCDFGRRDLSVGDSNRKDAVGRHGIAGHTARSQLSCDQSYSFEYFRCE